MGVSPYVSHLYSDLSDGHVIFQLYDVIRPGCVEWSRVITKFNRLRMMLEKIGNTTATMIITVTEKRTFRSNNKKTLL